MKVLRLWLAFLGFWVLHAHAGAIRIDPNAPDFLAAFAKTAQAPGNLIATFEFGRRETCCFGRRADWVEILIARNRRIPPAAEAASAVPEGGTVTLLALGFLSLLAYKCKKSALADALSKL